MKTLQEKYNAILEGNFSKKQFVRDARLGHPNLITQFNGFDDTVTILKNRGMIQEAKQQEVPQYDKPEPGYSIEALERAVDYELEGMGLMSQETVSEEDYDKAKKKAEKNLEKDPNHYLHLLSGDSKKVDKHDKYVEVKKDNHVDTFNGMKKAELKESIIEKAMSKGYTKEQVEAALNRLKEKKGKDLDGDGDVDSDDYMAAKDKAIKKAMGRKVDESKYNFKEGDTVLVNMGDGTKEELTVDRTFIMAPPKGKREPVFTSKEYGENMWFTNDMVIDKPTKDKAINEGRKRKMKGGKVVTENDYETGGYVEAMGPRLEKALKHLIQMWEEWKEGPMTEPGMVPHAKKDLINYITNQIQEQEQEEVLDEQFFDDLEAAKDYARKESEQGFVQHVNKHPKGGFRVEDWLDGSNTVASYQGGEYLQEDHSGNPNDKYVVRPCKNKKEPWAVWEGEKRVKGFANKADAKAFADKKNKEQGLNESQLKEVFRGIITNILNEEIITEAATGNLSKIASQYEDFEGMQSAVNALENTVTDIESYYSKTREKIQKVYDSFNNIKNPDGLNMGALLGPSIQAAFMKDLAPVREKGFTKGLQLPKVKIIKPGDIQEDELEEKKTVYSPVNEGRKTKYTKRKK